MQNTKYCVVTTFNLQLMEVGVTMGTGQPVQLNVVEVLRPDPGHAATLPLLTVEQIVREMPNRNQWRNVEGLVKKSPLGGRKSPLRGAPVSRV